MTITVRETKTERMTPVNQAHPGEFFTLKEKNWKKTFFFSKLTKLFNLPLTGDQEVIQKVIQHSNSAAPHASTATRELDDLMASLSDFKVCSIKSTAYNFILKIA